MEQRRQGTPIAPTSPIANGLYTGDEVRILGVAVGTIDEIDPQPSRTKVTFSVDRQYSVPADAKAAILSPSLVSARAIQLVPAYSGGPKLAAGASIPQRAHSGAGRVGRLPPAAGEAHRRRCSRQRQAGPARSASSSTPPRTTCGVKGDTARDTVIKLSQAVSALGDHSTDIFSTVRNLQLLVSALYVEQRSARRVQRQPGRRDDGIVQHAQRDRERDQGSRRRGERPARLPRGEPRRPRRHRRPSQRDHHRVERQPRRRQAGPAHRADGVPELHEHLPARAERGDRHPGARATSPTPFNSSAAQSRPRRGRAYEQSVEAVRAVPRADHQESAVQLSSRSGSTRSSERRRGRTRSPTARTG